MEIILDQNTWYVSLAVVAVLFYCFIYNIARAAYREQRDYERETGEVLNITWRHQ